MADDFEVGTFTPEQTRLLWQDYQERRQLQPHQQHNYPQRRQIDEPSPHRVFVKNVSGEVIPGYGCMQVTGTATEAGRALVTVNKPSTLCGEYLFNSPYPVELGAYGWAYAWGLVRMLGTAAGYSDCKRYAPVVDEWGVTEAPGPFLVYGEDGEQEGVVIGRIIGDHCKARWIKFVYDEEATSITVDEFYDGPDPTGCGDIEVEYPFGEPPCGGDVLAFYDPNSGKYQGVLTASGMLGPAVDVVVHRDKLTWDKTNLKYVKQTIKAFPCNNPLVPDNAQLPTRDCYGNSSGGGSGG